MLRILSLRSPKWATPRTSAERYISCIWATKARPLKWAKVRGVERDELKGVEPIADMVTGCNPHWVCIPEIPCS